MEEELLSLKQTLRSLVVSSPTTMTVKSLLKDYRYLVGGYIPLSKFGYKDPIKFLRERCTDVFVMEGPPWDPILTPKITKNLQHIYQMVQKQKVQSSVKFCDRACKASKGSVRQSTSSVSSTTKQAQLDDLKADILALIIGSQGVWCTDLIRLYKERYGRELGFNRFGYTSIISLVYSMEERIAITRPEPDGDWFLEDPAAVSAGAAQAWPVPPPLRRLPRYVSFREPEEEREDALPGVQFEAGVFPADCVHLVGCIPGGASRELRAGDLLEVMIGEVYSPSHFWIIRVGERYNLAMEAVMDEMNEYYRGEGASRVLARGAMRVGQYCASEYDHDWHRSLIVVLIDCDTVKVRHLDYGTVESVQVSGLKPLLRRWAELPAQAIRARLAGARPAAAGRIWPRAACSWLLHQVQDTRLYANVRGVDTEEDIVETFLIDTRSAEDVCLTRELIRVGHADDRPDSALKSGECYLNPAFSALESGDTPNYADISRYLADGITLDNVDSYRRHVLSLLDPPAAAAAAAPPRHDSHPHHLELYSSHATPAADDGAPSPAALPRPFEQLTRVPLLRVADPSPPQPPVAPPAAAPTQDKIPPPLPFSSASSEPPPYRRHVLPLLDPPAAAAAAAAPPRHDSHPHHLEPYSRHATPAADDGATSPAALPRAFEQLTRVPLLRVADPSPPQPPVAPPAAAPTQDKIPPPLPFSSASSEPPPYRRHVLPLLDPPAAAAAAAAPPRHDSHPHHLEPYSRHATPAADDGATSPAALPRAFEQLTRVPLLRVADPSTPQPPVAPPAAAPTQDKIPPALPFSSASSEPPPALFTLHATDHSRGVVVQLSEAEWSMLTLLRDIDPVAAQWYLMTAAYRTLHKQTPCPH